VPDFPYINARVRAMRSRLLDPGRIEELLALPSLDAFIQALGRTPYAHEIQEAQSRTTDSLRIVDEALARNFYLTTTKILSFADGKARALIELVLMRWDLTNIRIILRAKHTGRRDEEIFTSLIPAGRLNKPALKEIVAQPDVAGVIGALGGMDHPLAVALAEGLRDYLETKDLLTLELRLDRYYAAYGMRISSGRGHNEEVVRRFLQDEVDATNVKTAIKLQRVDGLRRDEKLRFFIPGSRATENAFLALTDVQTAERGIQAVRLQGFPIKTFHDDPAAMERELETAMLRVQVAQYLQDPLGIDVVIGYLAMKYNEVVNLRLVARSKALGIPRDRVRKEMAVV